MLIKIILHRIGRSQSDNRSHDILSLVSSVLTQQRPYLSTIFQKVHTLSSLIHFIPRYMGCLVLKLIGNQLSDGWFVCLTNRPQNMILNYIYSFFCRLGFIILSWILVYWNRRFFLYYISISIIIMWMKFFAGNIWMFDPLPHQWYYTWSSLYSYLSS